jgi:hypothetical protein
MANSEPSAPLPTERVAEIAAMFGPRFAKVALCDGNGSSMWIRDPFIHVRDERDHELLQGDVASLAEEVLRLREANRWMFDSYQRPVMCSTYFVDEMMAAPSQPITLHIAPDAYRPGWLQFIATRHDCPTVPRKEEAL